MEAERWSRLKDLFEAALEHEPATRADFVSFVCAGDPELRQELEDLLAHDDEPDPTSSSAPSSESAHAFAPGDLLANRFLIVSFLGRGGMGDVYEANDRDLSERVALKTLRPELASNSRNVQRLLQEVQSARRVSDPHVCRVHDVGRHFAPEGEVIFLTMAFVPGQTLAQHLRRHGPFPVVQALPLAQQICRGLLAIHRAGIVHRDFKAANVMLRPTDSGFDAIVTDFGLARSHQRPSAPEESLTEHGHLIGTPAYMAPELRATGDASPAADIYALGIVLCELTTGERQPPPHHPWISTIRKCLDPEPARRFLTASAVAQSLGTVPQAPTRRPLWLIASGALLFFLALSGLYLRFLQREPRVSQGATILVTPIANTTGDNHWQGVGELLRADLAQSAFFNIWDTSALPAVLHRMGRKTGQLDPATAREVALREGIPMVLFGSLSRLGDSLVLNLRLEQMGPHTVFSNNAWTYTASASRGDLLQEATHQASRWLRRTVGENEAGLSARNRLPQDITTPSWEALALYAAAESAQSENNSDAAIALLHDALSRDPDFALAHMRLGDILMSQGRRREGLASWQAAVAEAKQGRLARREELRIRGLYAGDTKDYAGEESAFTQMKAEYPYDYLATFYLANALRWQNRLQGSVAQLLDARRLMPASVPIQTNLAGDYLLLRQTQDALPQIKWLRAAHHNEQAVHYEGLLYFQQGDGPAAAHAFLLEKQSPEPRASSRGSEFLAAVQAEQGRYREAIRELNAGIAQDESAGRPESAAAKRASLAALLFKSGDPESARRVCLESEEAGFNPERLRRLGVLLARGGFIEDARRLAQAIHSFLPETRISQVAESHIQCEILAARRAPAEALQCALRLNDIEAPLRPRAYLALAYERAGRWDDAAVWFDQVVRSPQLLWQTVDFDDPGYLAGALLGGARVAARAGHSQLALASVRTYLERMRGADSGLPELQEATQLLHSLTAPQTKE